MWQNIIEPGRPVMIVRRKRSACWIPMAIDTLSEYLILIDFPLQQWLHEPTSLLRHMYIVCIVNQTGGVKVRARVSQ
jgi:hypothetical protein